MHGDLSSDGSKSSLNTARYRTCKLVLGQRVPSKVQTNFVEFHTESKGFTYGQIDLATHELAHSICDEMIGVSIGNGLEIPQEYSEWLNKSETNKLKDSVRRLYTEGITELIAKTSAILGVLEKGIQNKEESSVPLGYTMYWKEVRFIGDILQALAIKISQIEQVNCAEVEIVDNQKWQNSVDADLVELFKMLISFVRGIKETDRIIITENGKKYQYNFYNLVKSFLDFDIISYSDIVDTVLKDLESTGSRTPFFVKDEERLFPSWQICKVLANQITKENREILRILQP